MKEKINFKTLLFLFVVFVFTLPFALVSCVDHHWRNELVEIAEQCTVTVTAETKTSQTLHERVGSGGTVLRYRPVFSYSYEERSYNTEYYLTYAANPFPESKKVELNINPANPKMVYLPNDVDYEDNRMGSWVMYLPLLPLSVLIWASRVVISHNKYAWQKQLVDPDDLPQYVRTDNPDGEWAQFTHNSLYLTVRGTGAAFPSNPQFRELADVMYDTAERLDMDDGFRALHDGRKIKQLHVFYLNPERTEWLMGMQLPRSFIRKKAVAALRVAAEKRGIQEINADAAIISGDEERFEREVTDLVSFYPENKGTSDMWLLHDLYEDDVRNDVTEPASRSLMLHVDYKGKNV